MRALLALMAVTLCGAALIRAVQRESPVDAFVGALVGCTMGAFVVMGSAHGRHAYSTDITDVDARSIPLNRLPARNGLFLAFAGVTGGFAIIILSHLNNDVPGTRAAAMSTVGFGAAAFCVIAGLRMTYLAYNSRGNLAAGPGGLRWTSAKGKYTAISAKELEGSRYRFNDVELMIEIPAAKPPTDHPRTHTIRVIDYGPNVASVIAAVQPWLTTLGATEDQQDR
ncbi:MAG: hypothetical protein QM662_12565 [Gordonia sp. (in: high G+C Gram-positive bacteria)]